MRIPGLVISLLWAADEKASNVFRPSIMIRVTQSSISLPQKIFSVHSLWTMATLATQSSFFDLSYPFQGWFEKIWLEDVSLHSSRVFWFCVHFARFCRAFRERMLDLNLCKVNMSSGLEPALSHLYRYQMKVSWVVNVPERTLYDFGGLHLIGT